MRLVQRLLTAFRSAKLTLALLLVLAVLSVLGTLPRASEGEIATPRPATRVERWLGIRETFSSPVFLAATSLLTANILFCTAQRYAHAGRRRVSMLPDLLMHLSLVLVVAGGTVKGFRSVVRTVPVPVGTEASSAYDWKAGSDQPLGFALRVVRLDTEYHPFRARVGLRDLRSTQKIGVIELLEGSQGTSVGGGVEMRVLGVDRARNRADFLVKTPTGEGRISLSLESGPESSAQFGELGFSLVAYKDEVKMVRAMINAMQESGLVTEAWLSPNEGVEIGGAQVSLTAWGRDRFGNPYAGFQISRDPGAPLFWAGCIFLVVTIPLHLILKRGRRAAAVG